MKVYHGKQNEDVVELGELLKAFRGNPLISQFDVHTHLELIRRCFYNTSAKRWREKQSIKELQKITDLYYFIYFYENILKVYINEKTEEGKRAVGQTRHEKFIKYLKTQLPRRTIRLKGKQTKKTLLGLFEFMKGGESVLDLTQIQYMDFWFETIEQERLSRNSFIQEYKTYKP